MSSSGYIIEFNQETRSGLIEDDTTKQILPVHFNSFKQRSRRYLSSDNTFIGELFDFDIVTKQDVDTFEAVNVRHRVLTCPIDGCSRLKAFTNKKALDDHINIRHILKEEKAKASSSKIVVAKQPKKERRPRPKPVLINLSSHTTAPTIGRFIGKQGVNLKRIEQEKKVKLQLLDIPTAPNSVQILVKPISGITLDVQSFTKQLKFEWERCVYSQKLQENIWAQRLKFKYTHQEICLPPFESDSRSLNHLRFLETKRSKQHKLIEKWKYGPSESYIGVREGHRSLATCDSTHRYRSFLNFLKPNKPKRSMKDGQWLVNEQIQDLYV